jgi:hypothetical protein
MFVRKEALDSINLSSENEYVKGGKNESLPSPIAMSLFDLLSTVCRPA